VQGSLNSIPHNPKGMGHIERYHRIMRDSFLKLWKPALYCGPDMSKEVLDATARAIKSTKLPPPSLADFAAAYEDWLATDYHQRPNPEFPEKTRGQLWAELNPNPPHLTAAEIARPAELRTVRKGAVEIHKRRYSHPDLIAWNGKQVQVECNVLSDAEVVIRNAKGELICDAPLTRKIGPIADNLLEDKRQSAKEAALARLQKKMDEQKARAGRVLDADALVDALPAPSPAEGEIQLFDL
jgi:putative transposase